MDLNALYKKDSSFLNSTSCIMSLNKLCTFCAVWLQLQKQLAMEQYHFFTIMWVDTEHK